MNMICNRGLAKSLRPLTCTVPTIVRSINQSAVKLSRLPFSGSKKNLMEKYRVSDKVKEGFEIIYRAPMDTYILALSIGSAVTVAMCTAVGAYFLTQPESLDERVKGATFGSRTIITTNKAELYGFIGSFIGFNLIIFLMIRRFPLRIYRNADDYVAVFEGHIPLIRRQIHFAKGQVDPLPATGIMPWKDCRFNINGCRSILLEQYFKTPHELHRMMNAKHKYC